MENRKKILWITRTAIFIALLLVVQVVTKSAGQFITGSLVNFLLIASVMTCGFACGAAVAILSPIFAFFAGIGPAFPQILVIIVLANLSLVAVWHLVCKKNFVSQSVTYIIAIIVSAIVKFGVLYFGIVKLAIPFFLTSLPEKQVAMLSASFSTPQIITAIIGGILALIAVPLIKKAVK